MVSVRECNRATRALDVVVSSLGSWRSHLFIPLSLRPPSRYPYTPMLPPRPAKRPATHSRLDEKRRELESSGRFSVSHLICLTLWGRIFYGFKWGRFQVLFDESDDISYILYTTILNKIYLALYHIFHWNYINHSGWGVSNAFSALRCGFQNTV